ncbi:hypothetical protein CC78DRAFT_19836 [Lojkania enalia]|uniref:Uncharacterized protein n=1 Tax=Lojkania enalia TaxID=147567 RepID=A0A9P4N869_9PLEO|nr:hypothetical protein CC78DRAFT_19836 [Didymosphaeria enalia]
MPLPSFLRSPQLDQGDGTPATQSTAWFGGFYNSARTVVNGSSIYSNSPPPSNNNTPKLPFLGFLRRPQSPPTPVIIPEDDTPRESSDSRSPLQPHHTAGSYTRAIAPLENNLRSPELVYDNRHPADVPLDYNGSVDPETQQIQEDIHRRRRRRHRKRKHHHQHRHRSTHWVRRKTDKGVCFPFIKSQAARGKCIACLISGLFLMTVLTIYLTLALTRKDLGQEVHVLFIMVILATTIFFCHSLIRLFMLALHPPPETPRIPDMTGPEGFQPVRPIRVHLARDEELGDVDLEAGNESQDVEKPAKVVHPPPAYGLWRSSVRVNPNLLHWQRVENPVPQSPHPAPSRNGSLASAEGPVGEVIRENTGPRPPSYASEDGVSYVVEARPRSVAPSHTGVSDIHPAWRPGYAVSEVPAWNLPRRV